MLVALVSASAMAAPDRVIDCTDMHEALLFEIHESGLDLKFASTPCTWRRGRASASGVSGGGIGSEVNVGGGGGAAVPAVSACGVMVMSCASGVATGLARGSWAA